MITVRTIDAATHPMICADLGPATVVNVALAGRLEDLHGGRSTERDGHVLYYNGGAEVKGDLELSRKLYQDLVNRAER